MISLNPGAAFGTGSHETTRLCIGQLRRYVGGGERVLDIGTGSGILGIAALLSGARRVFATDLDEACVEAVQENLQLNGIDPEDFRLVIGNILTDEEVRDAAGEGIYDLVTANILAPVIISLVESGTAARCLKPGGLFICSGIIDEKEAGVLEAFEKSGEFEVVELGADGEWRSVTALRR
ncbi:MAG: 50S ribosomal protein L11 methyltransferase [Oscillospiraceae bacterium]|nr:50S ribosomal protein L11 methyltransferase [Oscillospiraceae bacterium]MBR6208695.1 50S ribosomal protein L11 methyltransferase [Oscillospiraceae bacterium]